MLSRKHEVFSVQADRVSKLYRLQAHQGSLREAVGQTMNRWFGRNDDDGNSHNLWALKDVSFNVRKGESWGIIGPNGAGKTTILKILSRITRPTEGELQINGRLAALIELAAGFHPDLTGRENIFLNGSILGLSRHDVKQNFDNIVGFSGLERFIDTPVKRYSSGMYVRLAFSVAAHTDPEILLVDEVLAVGDAEFRQKCIDRIKELRQNGVSIIFVSHNLFQVRAACDNGIFLLNGKINTLGSVEEAIRSYESWMRKNHQIGNEKFYAEEDHFSDHLQIIGIDLCDESGLSRSQFAFNDPVEIRVHFLAKKGIVNPKFVARILRDDGMVCTMLRSADLGLTMDRLEGYGSFSICLAELQLMSGAYFIEVRIRDAADAVTLAHSQSTTIQIIGPSLSGGSTGGVFLPRVTDVHVDNNAKDYSLP